jgi:sugar/nucleoside kinase (ribokinase family)
VVTCGAAGAVVAREGGVVARSGPGDGVVVVDAVGAGDAFAGAYLVAHLRGDNEAACLGLATTASVRALAAVGGRPPRQ